MRGKREIEADERRVNDSAETDEILTWPSPLDKLFGVFTQLKIHENAIQIKFMGKYPNISIFCTH